MITVVTDSTAYFSEAEAGRLGIVSIPTKYKVSSHSLFESYRDKNGEYINLINYSKNNAETRQISLSVFKSTFEQIIRNGNKVVCILISSRLSGSYYNACMAASDYDEGDIVIIDSLLTAGGLKLLTEKACLMINEKYFSKDNCDLKKIANEIESIRNNIGMIFSVESMEPLKKSGRLGFVRQSIGTALNIRPVLKCDKGTIVSVGTSRGERDRLTKMIAHIPDKVEKIIVNCNDDMKDIYRVKSIIKERFIDIPIEYNSYGPVLYVHIGKGAMALSWIVSV